MTFSLTELNAMSQGEFTAALGGLFEHSPWVAEAAWQARPFQDAADLHTKMAAAMHAAPYARVLDLLRAHPELAGKAMVSQTLTADSANEQTRSGLTACTPAEFARLTELNVAYNRKFGWPFILAVKHLDRATIIRTFAQRLENDAATEFSNNLQNIETITRWRLDALLNQQASP
jgi:2-oxo-4-hydroxy-4-carboxy-5-ureidoimidazoline decarboxylase